MGFWKKLKKQSKKTHDDLIHKLRLDTKSGKTVARFAGQQFVPPGVRDAYTVEKKTAKHSKNPEDIPGNLVRYSSRQARKEGDAIGTMGNYAVVIGSMTGQPELVAIGEAAAEVEAGIDVATAGAEDLAEATDDFIKGDPRAGVVALGRAVKKYGIAVMDSMTEGEMSHALEVAEDIMEGDYRAAEKEAASGLLDAVAQETGTSHLREKMDPFINRGMDYLIDQQEKQKKSSTAVKGGQASDPAMSSSDVVSASNVPDVEDLPGGEARREGMVQATDSDPMQDTITEAKKAAREAVASVQNLDDEMTMCGGSMVPLITLGELATAAMMTPHDRGSKRGYSALKMVPVQYANNGISTSNRLDRPIKAARVFSKVHENPIKNKLKNTPTVRGFTANFTTLPRKSPHGMDARGSLVKYVNGLRREPGRIHQDETDLEREKSMSFMQTIPEDTVAIDAKGPMKSTVRSRRVTRSMAKHGKEMKSVVGSKL